MAQLLLWNFKCKRLNVSPLSTLAHYEKDSIKWEARYFWSGDQSIVLQGIDHAMFDLNEYKHKYKEDYYYLLPHTNENIKLRRNNLLYKPQIKKSPVAIGFGPKIDLQKVEDYPPSMPPDSLQKLLRQTLEEAKKIHVKKESLTYRFSTSPPIKMELAKLEVHHQIYFSLCIEGKSLPLVEQISEWIIGKARSCDYVSFLRDISPL